MRPCRGERGDAHQGRVSVIVFAALPHDRSRSARGTLGSGRHHLGPPPRPADAPGERVFLIAIGIALLTGLRGEVIAWLRSPVSGFAIGI